MGNLYLCVEYVKMIVFLFFWIQEYDGLWFMVYGFRQKAISINQDAPAAQFSFLRRCYLKMSSAHAPQQYFKYDKKLVWEY